jgi:SAM-dependent methyltransferase
MEDQPRIGKNRDHEVYLREFNALPFERVMEKFRLRKIHEIASEYGSSRTNRILEVGPGYNSLAFDLWPENQWTLLEPSRELFSYNMKKFQNIENVRILNCSLEEYLKTCKTSSFDMTIMSSVLHELSDPLGILTGIYNILVENGKVLIVVPNNQSVHRQFGVVLKILDDTDSQTETEKLMQQKNNYSISSLQELVLKVGFKMVYVSTSFVKPNTHKQMQEWVDLGILSSQDLEHLYNLSFAFHPFNAEIHMVIEK